MKIFITVIISFFSLSVLAKDDLTGKKLICIVDAEQMYNYFLDFKSNFQVHMYFSTQRSELLVIPDISYIALPKIINILEEHSTYSINRKTLKLDIKQFATKNIVEKGSCNLLNMQYSTEDGIEYLESLMFEQKKVLQKNNKI